MLLLTTLNRNNFLVQNPITMVSFTSLVTAVVAATGALAAPATDVAVRSSGALVARQSTPNSEGTHNGCCKCFGSDLSFIKC